MRRSFGGLAALMFSAGKAAFVAEVDGRMVGGVTLGAFRIGAGRRGGVVKWLFTLPEARGHGVASSLLDHAMDWFAEQRVTDVFACIEGHNAGSSNRFAERGFEPLGFGEQLRHYGARLARVWWHTNHVVDVGHVLWAKRTELDQSASQEHPRSAQLVQASSGAAAFAATLAVHGLFGAVMVARSGRDLDVASVVQVAFAVAVVIGVRTAAMALAGRALQVHLRYRAWETGMTLTAGIATLFGGFFIAPGGLYPAATTWSARELGPRLALVSAAGVTAVLALGWAAYVLLQIGSGPAIVASVAFYARLLLLFDTLLPFFPMAAFSGQRILAASRPTWIALATGTVALWVLSLVG